MAKAPSQILSYRSIHFWHWHVCRVKIPTNKRKIVVSATGIPSQTWYYTLLGGKPSPDTTLLRLSFKTRSVGHGTTRSPHDHTQPLPDRCNLIVCSENITFTILCVSRDLYIYIYYIYISYYIILYHAHAYIYIYIYCACVWNGVFHQFMTMLVGNWVLIHCSLNFMTHPHHSIPLHYIPNRQPLFWIQDIATRTSMMTGSQTLAFAIFHVKVLATLRPVRSCDAPATSNILFILWKLYMNATSSRFIEPNAMVSTYDPSKNQLQALDPTAVEDWWWAELIYGIWATYSQVQAQNDEVCLQREGTPAFYLLCFSSERQENQLNRRVTYDMRSVLILLALCIRMREPPKYPKFQTKTERSHSKCSEWTNTQYISILCCFFMLILCIRLTWSTRELGPCFFYKARKFPVLARTPRRVFCSIPARWSQTSMVLPLLKPSNTWEPCGRRGKPGLVETSKRRVAVCVKMGHTGNKHYTTNLWLIQ